ncbi:hypothetical protein J5N97_007407 [Dioscorea zingiberensis]|uniref:SANT domain-containing protein n=1 Tax=Dioscorea zingiberensis TaxID=325984 RepID=A0A9D5DBY1_9LILI|nr:hypothetical protein J5N97_007407 [Dioscorea zingiberensis]
MADAILRWLPSESERGRALRIWRFPKLDSTLRSVYASRLLLLIIDSHFGKWPNPKGPKLVPNQPFARGATRPHHACHDPPLSNSSSSCAVTARCDPSLAENRAEFEQSSARSGAPGCREAMLGDSDSIDDIFSSHANANDGAPGKFRPKRHPKTTKPVPAPSDATKPNPANLDPPIHSTDLHPPEAISSECGIQGLHSMQEPALLEEASHVEGQIPESDANVQTDLNHSEVEADGMFFSTESFDELIQPTMSIGFMESLVDQNHSSRISPHLEISSELDMAASDVFGIENLDDLFASTAERQVGKFQPKHIREARPKTAKAKSVSFIPAVESQTSSHQIEETNVQEGKFIGVGTSLTQMMNNGFTDRHPQSSSVVSTCSAEIQTSEKSSHGETGKCQKVAEEPSNVVESQDAENLIEQILNEQPTWSTTGEDDGSSKSSRKLRKRTKVNTPSGEDCDDDLSNISQMGEDHSDNEYMDEDMSKQKVASNKSKKQTSENEKPVRRSRRASEKPYSTINQQEKKFPPGTRRKRRLVDKTLLEKADHEIDPRQIVIKDLILLAEAKERISNKEATGVGRSNPKHRGANSPNRDQFEEVDPFNEEQDGDELNNNPQLNPRKLNYHSYMNKTQSARWSKSETELFYQGIRQFGTDFAMIKQLFPNRTRHQVKLKFKNEERKQPLQIADALLHRSQDNSHFEMVIQQLQAQAEQSNRDEFYEPSVASEDRDGDEETNQKADKDEDLDDASDWDNNASYSPDKVKDILGDLFS